MSAYNVDVYDMLRLVTPRELMPQGTLPGTLFKVLGALSSLTLQSNTLSGPIPQELGLASSLMYIDLSNNSLVSCTLRYCRSK